MIIKVRSIEDVANEANGNSKLKEPTRIEYLNIYIYISNIYIYISKSFPIEKI